MSRDSEAWEDNAYWTEEQAMARREEWERERDRRATWWSTVLGYAGLAVVLGVLILMMVQDARMSPEEREQWARMEAAYAETGCSCEDGLGGGVIGGGVPRDMGGGGCTCGQEDW